MKDEEYVYVSDVRDKKITARSARNQRTHNGRRGRVKLPSDFLTKKELKAMSGEVKSYRLNNPMTWEEFKSMPDDIKTIYIKNIQSKYNAPIEAIRKMFGIPRKPLRTQLDKLGLNPGKKGNAKWDKEGFYAWANLANVQAEKEEDVPECEGQQCDERNTVSEAVVEVARAVPVSGEMMFKGNAEAALKTVLSVLGGANVKLTVTWTEITEDCCEG